MERMTERIDGWVMRKGCHGPCRTCHRVECADISPMIDRLAAYEDTGLEPEDIVNALKTLDLFAETVKGVPLNRIRELLQAEKDVRLVVLPCKTGDEVWTNFAMSGWYFRGKDRPYSAKVVFVGLNNSGDMGGGFINVMYGKYNYMMQFNFSEIGKTFFLTREEAEAAMKKREETI